MIYLSERSRGWFSYVEDSGISSKFSIDISNDWVGRVYESLAETGGKKLADNVVLSKRKECEKCSSPRENTSRNRTSRDGANRYGTTNSSHTGRTP